MCNYVCTEMDECGLSLIRRKRRRQNELLTTLLVIINTTIIMYLVLRTTDISRHKIYRNRDKKCHRVENLNALIRDSDVACRSELRMNRQTFFVLCEMVRDIGGLRSTRNMSLEGYVLVYLGSSQKK